MCACILHLTDLYEFIVCNIYTTPLQVAKARNLEFLTDVHFLWGHKVVPISLRKFCSCLDWSVRQRLRQGNQVLLNVLGKTCLTDLVRLVRLGNKNCTNPFKNQIKGKKRFIKIRIWYESWARFDSNSIAIQSHPRMSFPSKNCIFKFSFYLGFLLRCICSLDDHGY